MTNRDAYIFGWTFGLIHATTSNSNIGGDIKLAAMRPYSASARILSQASALRLLTPELDRKIGNALAEIDTIEPPMEAGTEAVQPIEIQSSWQLGYYTGRGGRPLSRAVFDIASARKRKNMTQAQLADMMDVDQAVISRWESGKVTPSPANLAKLKEILA